MAKDYVPTIDASLGLVYRLNSLWNRADWASLEGKYVSWNNILDTLYRNLLYRKPATVEEEKGTKKILSIKFVEKETRIYIFLSKQIATAMAEYHFAKSKDLKSKARSRWYHAVQTKDIWLRKFEMELNLYLKEREKIPGSAMFGGFGGKK